MQIADCRLQNAECRMQTADCRLQNAECRMQIADYRGGGEEGNLDFEKLLEALGLCSSQGDTNNRMQNAKRP